MRVDQCVSVVRAVDVPLLVYLRNSCDRVTEVRSKTAVMFVRLAPRVVAQNYGDLVGAVQL